VAWLGALFAEHMLHNLIACWCKHVACCASCVVTQHLHVRQHRSPLVMSSAVACMFDHSPGASECLNLVYSCDTTVVVGCQLSPLQTLRTLQHASQLQRSLDKL
jgi:hypothetical protein